MTSHRFVGTVAIVTEPPGGSTTNGDPGVVAIVTESNTTMLRGAGSPEELTCGSGASRASARDAKNRATLETKPNTSKSGAVTLICMASTSWAMRLVARVGTLDALKPDDELYCAVAVARPKLP